MSRFPTRVLRVGTVPLLVVKEAYGWVDLSDLPEMLVEPQPDFRKFKRKLYHHFKYIRSVTTSLSRAVEIDDEMFSHMVTEQCFFSDLEQNTVKVKTSCLGVSKT